MRDLNPMNGPAYGQNARPFLYGGELERVAAVLDTGQFGHGPVTEQFEQGLAAFLGVPDVVAVSTGTSALQIALSSAGVGPGDEVIVPSMTFCAGVQAIRACGAQPRFAEVDPSSLCMTSGNVMDALTPNTTAVMPVHYGGRATDLSDIHSALAERNIQIVEDAAHSFGSFSGTTRVGTDRSLLTCFSFGPIKNLTCGQGGAIVPRSAEEAGRARQMRMVGMVESPAERARSTAYRVKDFGLRAHMSQLNAAIGLAQLPHFPQAARQRKLLWQTYAAALEDVPGVSLVDVDVEHSVPHLCAVLVPHRDALFRALQYDGIGVGAHYPPNHLQEGFLSWYRPLPVTEQLGEAVLTLPFHQRMGSDDVDVVVAALAKALR